MSVSENHVGFGLWSSIQTQTGFEIFQAQFLGMVNRGKIGQPGVKMDNSVT